jgi:hypothetical protein
LVIKRDEPRAGTEKKGGLGKELGSFPNTFFIRGGIQSMLPMITLNSQ